MKIVDALGEPRDLKRIYQNMNQLIDKNLNHIKFGKLPQA